METFTGLFNPRRKRPRTDVNPSGSNQSRDTSLNSPLPNPPQTHPETEYTGLSYQSLLPVLSFPDGVEVWYDCPDTAINIYFVHGLSRDRDTTWTANGQSTPWSKTLLPHRLKKAHILTYSYDQTWVLN